METRRLLTMFHFCLGFFLLALMANPSLAIAWDNSDAHMEINRLALELFAQRQQSIPLLKSVSLDGDKCWGAAWDPVDEISRTNPIDNVVRQKKLAAWIVDGGFSADEPEGPMAMRHFYDPTMPNSPYLKDLDWINGFLKSTIGSLAENPQISAIDWATGHGLDLFLIPQSYSYYFAKEYYKTALADNNRDNQNYGKAWRALGETMHLMADMALAPHVRNDGHGLTDADPVEKDAPGTAIRYYYNTSWTGAINYEQSVPSLMHALAAYTNKNFFSKDTIPIPGKTYTANGRPAYPEPDISKMSLDSSDYLVGSIDGQSVRLARKSVWYRDWELPASGYVINPVVVSEHLRILAPTIVRATEAVLERFLPRFKVEAAIAPDPVLTGQMVVTGRIIHNPTVEWPNKLSIRNGVFVSVNGIKEAVNLYNNPDLNEFSHSVAAAPGDEVKVVYDLGGYVIEAKVGPAITSISPEYGHVGDTVTLTGMGFGNIQGGSTLKFNGAPLTVISWSDTQIEVVAPAFGQFNVTVNGAESNTVAFHYICECPPGSDICSAPSLECAF